MLNQEENREKTVVYWVHQPFQDRVGRGETEKEDLQAFGPKVQKSITLMIAFQLAACYTYTIRLPKEGTVGILMINISSI